MVDLVWLIPALPLLGFLLLLARRHARSASPSPGWLATAHGRPARSSSSVLVFIGLHDQPEHTTHLQRSSPGSRPAASRVDVGFLLDPLSMHHDACSSPASAR